MRVLRLCVWLFALLTLSGLAWVGWYVFVPRAALGGSSPPISTGSILLDVHFWAAQIALLAALVGVGQAFFVKTNRPHAWWAVGTLLLTALLWFTGMLLPWDQLSYWLAPLFRQPTGLFAVYWLHILILPALLIAVFVVYARYVRSNHHETHS